MLNQFKNLYLLAIVLILSAFIPINVFCNLNEMKKANLDTGLAGYWPMDEDFAITKKITDFSGKENHGTASVNLRFIKEEKINGAAHFDGQSYIDCGKAPSLNITNAVTLAAWVCPDDLSADNKERCSIIRKSSRIYHISQDNRKMILSFLDINDAKENSISIPDAFTKAGVWYHVTGVIDSTGHIKAYINGKLLKEEKFNSTIRDNNKNLFIGCQNGNASFFKGQIDEVCIWSRVLNEKEINALFILGTKAAVINIAPLKTEKKIDVKNMRKYYVATNGSDQGPGDEKLPFLTIQKAADTAHAGDQIIIRAGIYREYVVIRNSGTKEYPIVFSGERGADGSWKTIIDPGISIKKWNTETEYGIDLYSADFAFNPKCLTVNGKLVARIEDDRMNLARSTAKLGDKPNPFIRTGEKALSGLDILAMPKDVIVYHAQIGGEKTGVSFWEGIPILYGFLNGKTYLRFGDGRIPSAVSIKASPAGTALVISNAGHIIIRDLKICGAEKSLLIEGANAYGNVAEKCYFSHGTERVLITSGAASNFIRSNVMTLDYIKKGLLGAAGEEDRLPRLLYTTFKHISSDIANSDDRSVFLLDAGPGNEIYNNVIFQGLVGVRIEMSTGTKVYENIIREMSSVGIAVRHSNPAHASLINIIQGNLVYDCGINIRIHHLCKLSDPRRDYVYKNFFCQPAGKGIQIYVHNDDKPEGNIPESSVNIYHNTFYGGRSYFHTKKAFEFFIPNKMPLYVINNIFPSSSVSDTRERIVIYSYNYPNKPENDKSDADLSARVFNLETWKPDSFPCPLPAADSPAIQTGIDLSAPFVIEGKSFKPMPGMSNKYFTGSAPDPGALQRGEKINSKLIELFTQSQKLADLREDSKN